MAAKQIIKRVENCLDEEVRKIKLIYNNFTSCLFNTDIDQLNIIDHQNLFEQIKDQMCSIFDLYDQLIYTIENYNHLKEFINHKKLGNQCITFKRILTKYKQILEHVAYRGEFGIKSVNIRNKLQSAIQQLNLNSILINEQPYVNNLNMYTIDKESIFRLKKDEIKFTLINYSDLDLDIINVNLIEDNYLNNTIRSDDLILSNSSLINHLNNNQLNNKIEWIAQNQTNRKKFKIRIIYLMNNHLKSKNTNLIKYRFQIIGRWRQINQQIDQQIESQFYTDKFCLIQDIDNLNEFNDLKLMKLKQQKYLNNQLNNQQSTSFDLINFEFENLNLNNLIDNQLNRLNDNQIKEFNIDLINNDQLNCKNNNLKLEQCFKRILNKLNNHKNDKLYKLNDIEHLTLKERLINSGNFNLSIEQLLNKELDHHNFSFNNYFKNVSFCYFNVIDNNLRELIYGFLNRDRIIQLLSNSKEYSYLITFSQSILCCLVLSYLDDKNQLIEILFLEHNLRNDDLNNYLKSTKDYLKYPILKN